MFFYSIAHKYGLYNLKTCNISDSCYFTKLLEKTQKTTLTGIQELSKSQAYTARKEKSENLIFYRLMNLLL